MQRYQESNEIVNFYALILDVMYREERVCRSVCVWICVCACGYVYVRVRM